MKATGIVRRIDDLGRVVIPKELRRTLRIREGEPLEIYTTTEGEVIFKKYSPIGELGDFATTYADALSKTTGKPACITDRDNVIAVAGMLKKEIIDKKISSELDDTITKKQNYVSQSQTSGIKILSESEKYHAGIIIPIVAEGDVIGSVIFILKEEETLSDVDVKVAETAALFLGRHMEQ